MDGKSASHQHGNTISPSVCEAIRSGRGCCSKSPGCEPCVNTCSTGPRDLGSICCRIPASKEVPGGPASGKARCYCAVPEIPSRLQGALHQRRIRDGTPLNSWLCYSSRNRPSIAWSRQPFYRGRHAGRVGPKAASSSPHEGSAVLPPTVTPDSSRSLQENETRGSKESRTLRVNQQSWGVAKVEPGQLSRRKCRVAAAPRQRD